MKIKKIKRLVAFVPAMLLAAALLNSFVSKEKEKKPVNERKPSTVSNIIYKSTDGGQTWQDISKGLPERMQREGLWQDGLYTNDELIYLRAGNGVYRSESKSATSSWTKDVLPGNQRNIVPTNSGILAYNIRGQFLKKINKTNKWLPIYTNFQEQAVELDKMVDWMYTKYKEREVRAVFETADGTVFISSNNGLFRSTNSGKTWKHVHVGDGRMKLVEQGGVLLSTGKDGILRSTNNGESWENVLSEGGLGIAVEPLTGGFAAIVENVITKTNTLHVSQDNGKTWNEIGAELQPSWNSLFMKKIGLIKSSPNIFAIKQMGKYLLCGRSDGIYRSSDMGKTWEKLVLPNVKNKGFNLTVGGSTLYIMPNKGC